MKHILFLLLPHLLFIKVAGQAGLPGDGIWGTSPQQTIGTTFKEEGQGGKIWQSADPSIMGVRTDEVLYLYRSDRLVAIRSKCDLEHGKSVLESTVRTHGSPAREFTDAGNNNWKQWAAGNTTLSLITNDGGMWIYLDPVTQ